MRAREPSGKPVVPGLDDLPLIVPVLDEDGRLPRVSEALDRLANGIHAGRLAQNKFRDVEHTLIFPLQMTWTLLVRSKLVSLGKRNPDAAALGESLTFQTFADILAAGPALAALRKGGWPGTSRQLSHAMAVQAEMASIATALEWLRPPAASKGDIRPEPPPPPPLPPATLRARTQVETVMRTAMDGLREGFIGEILKACEREALALEDSSDRLRALRASMDGARQADWPSEARREAGVLAQIVAQSTHFARPLVDRDPYASTTRRFPDGAERARRFAEGQADEAMSLCVARNVEKLAPTVEAMGGADIVLRSATVSYEGVKAVFEVAFPAGGRFRVTNGIVYGTTREGTPYTQFPARFHDVVAPDGTAMKGPSEAKVREAFTGRAEAEEAPRPRGR